MNLHQVSPLAVTSLFQITSLQPPYVTQNYLSYDDAFEAHDRQCLSNYHFINQIEIGNQSVPTFMSDVAR